MRSSAMLKSASVLLALVAGPARADEPVTLEYWVYSDFAQGDALALQQTFISEFKEKHPNVTINISGRGDDDLDIGHFAAAYAMNEACTAADNVFYAEHYWLLKPDAVEEEEQPRRTKR